jgi:DNA-binding NtrC family response regulator
MLYRRETMERENTRGSVVVVDDDRDSANALRALLSLRGFTATAVSSAAACLEHLEHSNADVVVTDVHMPVRSGIELCEDLRERHPGVLALVLTGRGDLPVAISAIRAGAYDYLAKPVAIDAVEIALVRAMTHLDLRREVSRLRASTGSLPACEGIVGDSRQLRETVEMIRRMADTDVTVLISGESGTGKELAARALHQLSSRRDKPFVAVNCAAMPAPLLESELFGHTRGAFTDAREPRSGLFVQAGDGTVFLDEIGDMPLEMQVKLLRVLQERTLRPVGSDVEVPFRARVLTATNRDLEQDVANKRFREDLFYRINVVGVSLPPLREREGDALVLAQFFLRRIAQRSGKGIEGITPHAARMLAEYDWPGNVRELENCIERAVALCRYDQITPDDLPEKLHMRSQSHIVLDTSPDEMITLAEMELRYVRRVVAMFGGNKTRAARALGIDRRSLYRRIGRKRGAPEVAGEEEMVE